MADELRRWIAVVFEGICTDAPESAWIVRAESEQAAAAMALELFTEEWQGKGNAEVPQYVFVAPWDDRVAYRLRIAADRAGLQCCAGPAPDYVECGGHYATCPQRPEGTGQPRGDDD